MAQKVLKKVTKKCYSHEIQNSIDLILIKNQIFGLDISWIKNKAFKKLCTKAPEVKHGVCAAAAVSRKTLSLYASASDIVFPTILTTLLYIFSVCYTLSII